MTVIEFIKSNSRIQVTTIAKENLPNINDMKDIIYTITFTTHNHKAIPTDFLIDITQFLLLDILVPQTYSIFYYSNCFNNAYKKNL